MEKKKRETIFNNNPPLGKWEFIQVYELYPLNELRDGIELYSRIEEKDDAESYIHIVNLKAAPIRAGFLKEVAEPV